MKIFYRNTKTGQPNSPESIIELEPAEESQKVADAAARLGEQLEAAQDGRKEERFVWITIVVILVDVMWFKDSPNPTLPVIVLVLQLILLIILARRMGIDDVVELIDRFLHAVGNKGPGS
ncbi:hypothetical protein [Phenylobacterium sp.]|uniref:hypothetical protein n=1 Tax=Phenylobacterium sp. TaxID=1871053 RepID=UPI00403638A7